MKVLFTCVGNSDPMTIFKNCEVYDGSYLHIARMYKPDKIYMYMSKAICKFDEDGRYEKAVEFLSKQINKNIEIVKIRDFDLIDVHRYDKFFSVFDKIIDEIVKDCGEDVEIICNISSGTPAMKSALQTISAFSKYKLVPIQVSNPTKGEIDRDVDLEKYDVTKYWDDNLDNILSEDRSFELENVEFLFKVQKESLIGLIQAYDYDGAYRMASTYKNRIDKNLIDLLGFAVDRYNLDLQKVLNFENKHQLNFFSYKDKEEAMLTEYGLWMIIKCKRGELLDFLRALNPFMYGVCNYALNHLYNIDLKKYCDGYKLKRENMTKDDQGKELLEILDNYFKSKKNGGYINSDLSEKQMLTILYDKLDSNDNLCQQLKILNRLREEKRNIVSHRITCVKEDDLKKDLDKSINDYIKSIKIILACLNFDMRTNWDSYNRMNGYIIDKIKTIK